MSRDYARKSRTASKPATSTKSARPARKQKQPPKRPAAAKSQRGGLSLKWILSLAAVGGFIGFIAYLNSLPTSEPRQGEKATTAEPPAVKEKPSETAAKEKPGFRFYDMLPDSEVVPPEVEEYTPGPGQQTFDYLVQTGSFRQQQDAERQRAEIAFQGLRAKVKRIDLDSGSIWYRVNVGPFTSRSQMNAAIDKLVNLNIQPLVRKIPKEG
ncbi:MULTISPECIES: SPOR domain-containing protein [Marinobacter]|jgi:cell division protein FtsN|uniref:SPOR domain-containing protein n=1 Tax=Marinobacter TaxID=2742 RepID=UPI0010A9D243|nr:MULTISPECIES: SPOR domain-containing protein [Marinobacter]MBJ7302394.1 SPOR domain-containing protein [Marinobacter salarius]MDC8457461.1 SPOR domain-containing protein [Marinobacter sp. DS40M6]MDP4534180.1 SPOR domain-containing protein [Marinobacter salarius]HIO30908.1 sporulation protein [Marinobacter salarius]HIP00341.1 sporulation protein [Marinobacter salarius]